MQSGKHVHNTHPIARQRLRTQKQNIFGRGVFYLVRAEVIMTTTDRGFVHSAKGRVSNNMLYVRYVHLTKAKHIRMRHTHPLDVV
jgi:hypothetical protein